MIEGGLAIDPAVRGALLTVAGHGLPRTGAIPPPPRSLDDHSWRSLMALVQIERLSALLDRAVADGALPATASQAEEAELAAYKSLRSIFRLERSLIKVVTCLDRAGIPFLVLKGPAIARLDEPDPSIRHYVDLDLLVRGETVASALSALAELGYKRDLPQRRPDFDWRFAKEVSLANEMRLEIDLHRTLALGPFGLALDLSAFWESTDLFILGKTTLNALGVEARFIHACLNAMLGDDRPRLVALRDVARIATSHPLRTERLRRLAPPGRGGAVVAVAVETCRTSLAVDVGDVAASYAAETAASLWERVALRAYRAHGGSNTLELLAGAMGVRGADRIRYLGALLLPDAAYVAARKARGRPREWATGLKEIARRRPTRVGSPKP